MCLLHLRWGRQFQDSTDGVAKEHSRVTFVPAAFQRRISLETEDLSPRHTPDSPYACYTDHGLLEILVAVYTVGGEQHGLTGTLALVLGDISRVSVEAFFGL
jgi:hypothetical protein